MATMYAFPIGDHRELRGGIAITVRGGIAITVFVRCCDTW